MVSVIGLIFSYFYEFVFLVLCYVERINNWIIIMVGNGVYDGGGYVLILCLCRVLCDLVYFIDCY